MNKLFIRALEVSLSRYPRLPIADLSCVQVWLTGRVMLPQTLPQDPALAYTIMYMAFLANC